MDVKYSFDDPGCIRASSTTTTHVRLRGFAKYYDHRVPFHYCQGREDAKYHEDEDPCTTTVDLNNYENMYHLPSPEDPCTTTDAVYDYFPRQHLNNYFHYARIPWMRQVPLRTCMTTVAKIASTSTVAVNNYFPRRLEPLRKRTLRRYNPETTFRE